MDWLGHPFVITRKKSARSQTALACNFPAGWTLTIFIFCITPTLSA